VREEVEVLKHHPDLGTDFFNVFDVVRQFDAVHHDPAPLVFFETIDAANERGFP